MQVWMQLRRANKVGRLHQSLKRKKPGAGRGKADKQHLGRQGLSEEEVQEDAEHTPSPSHSLPPLSPAMPQSLPIPCRHGL